MLLLLGHLGAMLVHSDWEMAFDELLYVLFLKIEIKYWFILSKSIKSDLLSCFLFKLENV